MKDFTARHVAALAPSGIRKYFDIANGIGDVISLGIGEPDFVTPPAILQAGVNALLRGATHYTPNNGLPELCTAIAQHMAQRYGVQYDPDTEILVTVGVSEALHLALSATLDPGDEVIIPSPCFVAYPALVALTHGVPHMLPTVAADNFQLAPTALQAALSPRSKALLIGYPSNPTGAVMPRAALQAVLQVAADHDLLVISDEIYDRLVYGCEHVCVAALPGMRERTITLGGFSKDYAMTGWRLGFAAGPEYLISALRKIHQYTIMSAPTSAQYAALAALASGDAAVEEMRVRYDRRRLLIHAGLNALGLDCCEPQGAFYAFPAIGASGMDDHMFADRLLAEERVAVVPGSAFGPGGAGHVRCSYANSYDNIQEALQRTGNFMRRHG